MSEKKKLIAAEIAFDHLRFARCQLKKAGCVKTLARVQLAISSVKGAIRNRKRFAWKETE